MKEILYVGAGSAIGGISRYLAGRGITAIFNYPFPLGTFLINVAGSLAIGYFIGISSKGIISQSSHLFLVTGLCGGFTTFSAFSMENMNMLRNGQYGLAITYMAGSVVIGLLACLLGYHFGK
jgi:fluoride exporter